MVVGFKKKSIHSCIARPTTHARASDRSTDADRRDEETTPDPFVMSSTALATMRVGALARYHHHRGGGYRARSTTTTRAGERYMATERVRVRENADGGVTYSFDEDAPPVETVEAPVEEPVEEPVVAETPTATFEKQLTWVGETTTTTTTEETEEEEEEVVDKEENTDASESDTKAPPISKMKKAELVALCEELGLDSSGTVAALRGRLGPAVRGRAA